ncbi:hypothetical protein EDB82DRAFT_84654 [Fusarium venenatum]|uniref:uncharacterized protein n=1 Tax=Fusarium venenatum TaxID=56646 RepID=UPI001D8FC036|nr:hypothetical protein EDB82DRAFT_84654 [Fusarium venenatum]
MTTNSMLLDKLSNPSPLPSKIHPNKRVALRQTGIFEKCVFGSVPELLSQVISGMTGLQIISLDPKPFTVSDGRQFYDAILDSPERPIWWEMYSIRIRGANVLGACIIGRSNYRTLKFVDIDGWITSSGCEKMEAVRQLERLRLYYDEDHVPSPERHYQD